MRYPLVLRLVENIWRFFWASFSRDTLFIDPKYYRPTEVDLLLGDAKKAREKLGWEPKYDLDALVSEMVSEDLKL